MPRNSTSWLPRDAQLGLRRSQLAAVSAPGSIAARSDPGQYGSILSRKYPGLFDPGTVQNIDFMQRRDKLDAGIQDQTYAFNASNGLHRMQLDRGVDDAVYRAQQLQSAGIRRPLRKPVAPGMADPSLYDDPYNYGEDNGY